MAEIKNVFDISGHAMAAQMVRLNTIASNLANAGNLASSEEEAYRSMKPIFETRFADRVNESGMSTTQVVGVTKLDRKPERNDSLRCGQRWQPFTGLPRRRCCDACPGRTGAHGGRGRDRGERC